MKTATGRCEITLHELHCSERRACIGIVMDKLRAAGFPIRESVWDAARELPAAIERQLLDAALLECGANQIYWRRLPDRTIYEWA